MHVTIIGSHLCPDTLYAINVLAARKVDITFQNLSASLADLKAYLALRESSTQIDRHNANGTHGIPCFILDDGFTTLELEEVLARL